MSDQKTFGKTSMFFVAHSSFGVFRWSTSYYKIDATVTTEEDMLKEFESVLSPFETAEQPECTETLYRVQEGMEMGEEIQIAQKHVTFTAPIPWGGWEDPRREFNGTIPGSLNYTHPLDKTVTHKEIPQWLKQRLKALAKWRGHSFPNGSSYAEEYLPDGKFGDISINAVYNACYYIRYNRWDLYLLRYDRVGVGSGTELGAHFCSRDQALKELIGVTPDPDAKPFAEVQTEAHVPAVEEINDPEPTIELEPVAVRETERGARGRDRSRGLRSRG